MSVSEQARNFCLFFIIGIIIHFIFDILRGIRKNFKTPNIIVDLQDILFLLLIGWIYFRSILLFNNGNLRFYLIFSSIIGIIIYSLTLSESCVIMIAVIFGCMKRFLQYIGKLLKIPYCFAKIVFLKLKSKIKE